VPLVADLDGELPEEIHETTVTESMGDLMSLFRLSTLLLCVSLFSALSVIAQSTAIEGAADGNPAEADYVRDGNNDRWSTLNLSRDLVRLGIAPRNLTPNDSNLDARPLFQAGLAYAGKHPISLITLDQGAYYFLTPENAQTYLVFEGLSDLRVDLAGSKIYFAHPFLQGFLVSNCRRVTLTNFEADFLNPPYTHVRLASVDAQQRTLAYSSLPDWPNPEGFNGATTPLGPPVLWAVAFRNGSIVPGTSRMQVAQPISGDVLTLVQDKTPWTQSATLSTLEPGDTIVVTERGGESLINASRSDSVVFSNFTIYGSSAMAVLLNSVSNSTVDHVRVMPRPGSALVASNADGIHFVLSGPDNHIRNSFVTRTLDDALAIDSLDLATVTDQSGPRKLTVKRSFYRRFPNGTAVHFVDPTIARELGGATIVSQNPPDSDAPVLNGSVELTFARDLPAIAPGFGMAFADASDRGAGSSIEDNEVREISFGRGVYIAGAEGVTVEHNTIGHTSNAGIAVFQNTAAYPSPPSHDITIQFNEIHGSLGPMASGTGTQTATGAILVTSTNNTNAYANSPVNTNIRIRGNRIVDSGRSGIWIGELDGGLVEDNTIDNWYRHPELPLFGVNAQTAALLEQDFTRPIASLDSSNLRVQGNHMNFDPPTDTITVLPASVVAGNSATISWNSSNATACTAGGAWGGAVSTSGSQSITPLVAGRFNYSLTCIGIGGSTTASASLTVTAAPPTVKLSASAASVYAGQPITLTWTALSVTSCAASGAWAGKQPISGSRIITPSIATTLTYTLACTGPEGDASSSVAVVVSTPSLSLKNVFAPNDVTISTSEGAPYGNCDFWAAGASNCAKESKFGFGPTKVVRIYICLSGEVSTSTCSQQSAVTGALSASMLADIDSRIAAFAGTGIRLMVRFTYNFGPIGPGAMDAPINVISKHIDQVAPVLLKNKDLIFAIEAGFIGTWGEWHDSTNGNDTAVAHKVVLDKELSYFSGAFPILVREPADLIQYNGNLTPSPALGLHDDYYASNSTDAGTFENCDTRAGFCLPQYSSDQLRSYAATVSATTMFAGEFGAVYPPLQSCSELDEYSYIYHAQSITLQPASIGTELEDEGCALSFYNKVGTRIELKEATIDGSPSANGRLHLVLTLANTGFGRVIRPRPVTLLFVSSGRVVAQFPIALADMDLRQLKASATTVPQTYLIDVTMPPTFPTSGSVSAVLLIPDPVPSLGPQPAYALPLNSLDQNDNPIFDPATGFNLIATFNAE
jgi:hypothetical protein